MKHNVKGVIISGFPCIGKSDTARVHTLYIDLESSAFKDEESGEFDINAYVNCAMDLARQGRYVFVSSHKNVRDRLSKFKDELLSDGVLLIVAYPCLIMKNEWVRRSARRYANSHLEKDQRAAQFISERYLSSVQDMFSETDFLHVIITGPYNLNAEISEVVRNYNNGAYDNPF